MATTTYLNAPNVTIGAVDVSDQCKSCRIVVGFESKDATAYGDTGRKYRSGLQAVNVTLVMFNSYGAAEVEATLASLVGDGDTTLVIKKASGAAAADNPVYTISNAMLAEFDPLGGSVGELTETEVTFTGGTYARTIA